MSGDKQQSQGIVGFLLDELRGAIQDIRQKVVEEGWFGRVVTAAPVVEVDHALGRERGSLYSGDHRPVTDPATAGRSASFEAQWGAHAPGEAETAVIEPIRDDSRESLGDRMRACTFDEIWGRPSRGHPPTDPLIEKSYPDIDR